MTLLTAVGALAALALLLPLAAWVAGRNRAGGVRRTLGLPPPAARRILRTLAIVAAIALLGLAVAQPALTHGARVHERTDTEALFVFDTSRSMAASETPTSATRLDRAVAAAVRLRAAIPDVPAGVVTLTDRVLPDLLPVPDVPAFDAVAERGVAIESPPPADTSVRATTFAALSQIASGDFFAPKTARRLVVLLTDGESNPVDAGELARRLPGYRFVALRFWRDGEAVYKENGQPESAYRPDPLGRVVLDSTARGLGGRAFEEGQIAAATSYLKKTVGHGPAASEAAGTPKRTPLAPYLAGLALLLLLLGLLPLQFVARAVHSRVQ